MFHQEFYYFGINIHKKQKINSCEMDTQVGPTKVYTWDHKMDVDFLVSPTVYHEGFRAIPFDQNNPRAIPFPDGPFGDNPHVVISGDGKKVTFDLQQGPTVDGCNGTYVDAMILFARALLEAKNIPPMSNRWTSMAITDLENANLHLFARAADRSAREVHGTNNK